MNAGNRIIEGLVLVLVTCCVTVVGVGIWVKERAKPSYYLVSYEFQRAWGGPVMRNSARHRVVGGVTYQTLDNFSHWVRANNGLGTNDVVIILSVSKMANGEGWKAE